jgi:phosphoribosylformylglycinamidine synthase
LYDAPLSQVAEPLHRTLGLTDGELDRIRELMGRDPNHFELAVFSLLWSEHCAYKHSALLLRRFPTDGPRVLQGPGENAGVLDLGDGQAVAFKVESHNHPSAVEPFQGAATGVGGILRDIVAMGARPVALLDGLRFGHAGFAFDRAVAGIGGYGNSVGVPTVGGEAFFDESYADNCLVNAMCVGLLPADRVTRAKATTPGHLVVLYGSTTGRDGIGGASVLASQELGEGAAEKRPSVQIGDPFTGNRLIEVSVELVERGLVESLQDCGAAGLASALAEMARDGAGVDVHLDRVPLREELEPWEIMISESQERMVAVLREDFLGSAEEIFTRWDLAYAVIGTVTDTGLLCCYHDREQIAEIPARFLTDEAPRYEVEQTPRPTGADPPAPVGPYVEEALLALLASPNIRSRSWIYERYDHLVGSRTVRRPGLDAAILRLRPSLRGLALSLDGPGRIARAAPRTAGAQAVLEATRNVACAGGEPIGLTDCLNFGNPEKPEIAWELAEAIEGMARAAEALRIPVVSGNVSLYNETDGRAILPAPVVGCVGLVPDVTVVPGRWHEGDVVLIASAPKLSVTLAWSEYQALYGELGGARPHIDLGSERALVEFLWRSAPILSLAHDVSGGGPAVALAQAALWSGVGAEIDMPPDLHAWFGEGGGQAVVACARSDVSRLEGVTVREVGVVGGDTLFDVPLDELGKAWSG